MRVQICLFYYVLYYITSKQLYKILKRCNMYDFKSNLRTCIHARSILFSPFKFPILLSLADVIAVSIAASTRLRMAITSGARSPSTDSDSLSDSGIIWVIITVICKYFRLRLRLILANSYIKIYWRKYYRSFYSPIISSIMRFRNFRYTAQQTGTTLWQVLELIEQCRDVAYDGKLVKIVGHVEGDNTIFFRYADSMHECIEFNGMHCMYDQEVHYN
ncbi:hypothetical protein C0J52_20794 [Blattella germanica]|nr:hypothetical protein C0J52_20794 [Blattella germanica]